MSCNDKEINVTIVTKLPNNTKLKKFMQIDFTIIYVRQYLFIMFTILIIFILFEEFIFYYSLLSNIIFDNIDIKGITIKKFIIKF